MNTGPAKLQIQLQNIDSFIQEIKAISPTNHTHKHHNAFQTIPFNGGSKHRAILL